MAGIITDVSEDIQKLQRIKAEIADVKKELKGIDIRVRLDLKEDIEARLKSLMGQYNEVVLKIAKVEGEAMLAAKKIDEAINGISSDPLKSFDAELLKMCNNLNKYFDELLAKVESMSSLLQVGKAGIDDSNSNNIPTQQLEELRSKNLELTEQLRAQKDEIKQQQEEWNKLATALKSNNVSAIEQYKQATNSSSDAVKSAKAEQKGLTKDLNENIKYYDTLAAQIASYNSILERLYAAKNKGMTRVPIGDGATALISSELERFKPQLDDTIQKSKEIALQISDQRKRQAELNLVIEQGNEKHLRTRTLIMDAREQLIQMRAAGLQNTPQYQQASEELGRMRKQMVLVNSEMAYLSNPNKHLEALKTGLQGVAGSASLVVGVMGLFNQKNEEMIMIQTKIQSLLGIIIGLESAYNTVKKSSMVMRAIESVQTKALIASQALEAKAKATNIALTWSEVAAQKALNAVAKVNPYILLGTAILTVVGGMALLIKATKEAKSATKDLLSVEQEMALARKKAVSDSTKERTELDLLYKKLKDTSLSTKERTAAVNEWMKKYPQHSNIMNGELVSLGKLELAYQSLSKQIIESAKTRRILDEITKLSNQAEEAEFKRLNKVYTLSVKQKELEQLNIERNKALVGGYASDYLADVEKRIAAKQEEIDSEIDGLYQFTKAREDATRQAEELENKIKTTDLFPQPEAGTYDYWQQQVQIADTALKQIDSKQKALLDNAVKDPKKDLYGLGIDKSIVDSYKQAIKLKSEAENELKAYDSSSKQESAAEKLRQQTEKYKLLLDKQKLEQIRANEDLQMQADEARIKAMKDGSKKTIAQMEFDFKKEMQTIDRQKEDLLRKKIENAREAFEANPANKGKSFAAFYEEALKVRDIGGEMETLFGGGNVDLLARPMIDAAKLVEKGWKDAGEGIATVFSSSYEVEQDGKNVMIQVTPILPDGTVLSQDELETYIDTRLNGAKDILESDDKGIVIHVDTDVNPEKSEAFGQKLHEYQEKFYDGIAKLKKKDGTFDLSSFGLTDQENDFFNSLLKTVVANYDKSYSDIADKYQSYTDERLAIEKKFNDDIEVLEEARRRAVKKGDSDEVAKIDRSKAQATRDKGKELMGLDFEQLKKSPEYVRAFENLKQTSTDTLSSLLKQLEAAKRTAAEVLNPEDLREYTSTIQSIIDELTERNPFQTIIDKKKELVQAEQELAEAKKTLDAVNNGEKIIVSSHYNKDTGKIEVGYLTVTEALKKYNKAKDHVIKTDDELVEAEKTVSEQVDELGNSLKNIGGIIGGTSGEIISLMGDITSFASLSMEGVSKLTSAAAAEMSALEKASVILGIISAAIQLLQQLDSLIGDAHSQYEGYAEKIKEINALTDAVNEYRIAALEAQQVEKNWFSEDNLRNLRDYRELHDEVANAYDEKKNEQQAVYQNESGGGWLTSLWKPITKLVDKTYGKIFGFNINKEYEEGTAKAIENLRIETRKKSKGFLGTGIGGKSQKTDDLVAWARKQGLGELFDDDGLLNKELAQSLIDNYGDKLVGQTKETLESLLELREKYDEYLDQLHEYVNSLYEPLVDNFVDGIWDWLDTGKDALDSFKDYASDTFRDIAKDMIKSIVLSKIFGEGENSYQNKINKVYDDYAKGLIDEVELNRQVTQLTAELMDNAETQLPVIQGMASNIANTIKDTTGIDITNSGSSSQSSTSGGFQTMSQDSADELNGRFTALQMAGEEIKNQAIEQTGLLSSIYEKMSLLDLTNDDIPKLMANVPDIAGQTRESIINNYQPQVNIVFPDEKINVLTAEVSTLKYIVDEMRTLQVEGNLDRQEVRESIQIISKNSPKVLDNMDEIKRDIRNAI